MTVKIALAGNPNSGKTTLFNTLTGSNQYVGNWPGVTVEKKEGKLKGNKDVIITDLPGIYSLSPYTLEEVVARNYLLDEKPAGILNIVDGTNLERNLYLTTQLAELGIPMIVAINMMDVVRKNGDKIDIEKLSKELGCPVVEISALKEDGVDEAIRVMLDTMKAGKVIPKRRFDAEIEHILAHIEEAVLHDEKEDRLQRWYAIKLFERDNKAIEKLGLSTEEVAHIEEDIVKCEKELDDDSEALIIAERYGYVEKISRECLKKKKRKDNMTVSDRIDNIVTNRILALPIFAAIMFMVYYISVSTVGALVTDWTNDVLFGEIIPPTVEGFLVSIGCAEWLMGLILDGIIGGVGAVLGFVPQLLVLFLFLAFLEGCGYMSRVAFILDRIFRKFGLSGKSFIPIIIGTGCGVPGIMASRTIENPRDRKMTIITTTFIPCGAKLPIIALIAGALFGGAWWVAPSAYFVGITAIICSGIILKKTKLFAGEASPFVMELPAYHLPTVSSVLRSMWERGWSFIKKAGTVILLSTIVIWFATYFGWVNGEFRMLDTMEIEHSILAVVGGAFAWIFEPIGFGTWQSAVATITGLIAKENVVATFGVLYGLAEVAEDGAEYWGALQAAFTTVSAYSFLVFNLLCAPCFAAMGAIKREMNNTKWFLFAIGYQTGFAYLVSFCIYNFGNFIVYGTTGIGLVIACAIVVGFLYLLFRKDRYTIN